MLLPALGRLTAQNVSLRMLVMTAYQNSRSRSQLGVNMPMPPQGFPEARSLMTQLQEDLGLKLDSQRGPGEVLVIDSAELPTPD